MGARATTEAGSDEKEPAGEHMWAEVRGYVAEVFWRSDNQGGVRGQVGAYHHMLSTYVNALVEAGLRLERLCEPRASGHVAERVRGYGEVPNVYSPLAVECHTAPCD
jgi:hypothetical protein